MIEVELRWVSRSGTITDPLGHPAEVKELQSRTVMERFKDGEVKVATAWSTTPTATIHPDKELQYQNVGVIGVIAHLLNKGECIRDVDGVCPVCRRAADMLLEAYGLREE